MENIEQILREENDRLRTEIAQLKARLAYKPVHAREGIAPRTRPTYSSERGDWETPQDLFDEYNKKYGPFVLDAAADEVNTKCNLYYSPEEDALTQDWSWAKRIWVNPPYGRGIKDWVIKAYKESLKGCRVVILLPARSPGWYHDYVDGKATIIRLRKRLKFAAPGREAQAAPFDSMIAIYETPFEPDVNTVPKDVRKKNV